MSDNGRPDRRRPFSLRTARMEAFSDGIFAIASTLLVLDLSVPATSSDVAQKLRQQRPMYLAYLVSFLSIGQAWLNHSVITDYLDRADSILLRLNLVLLFSSGASGTAGWVTSPARTDAGRCHGRRCHGRWAPIRSAAVGSFCRWVRVRGPGPAR